MTILLTMFTIKQLSLNDDASHFKLARSVVKIASSEFANLEYFNSTSMNLNKWHGMHAEAMMFKNCS